MYDRANQAFHNELEDGEPAEQPLVELGYEDEEGNDMEGISDDEQDGETSDEEAE